MSVAFALYHTDGCHLCELAFALVVEGGYEALVGRVDIVDDPQLVGDYGTSIPVLKHLPSASELNWPFDRVQLAAFMNAGQ